jgi:hypothetical protein
MLSGFLLIFWFAFSCIGRYLWALRGGNFFRKGKSTQVNRLFYFLPTTVLIGLGLKILFPIPFPILGFIGAVVLLALGIVLGHGLFMDMGRYVAPNKRKEVEAPFSWVFGPAYYDWPRNRRFNYDFWGMVSVGVIRHSWVWPLVSVLGVWPCAIYTALGFLHAVFYELGHRIGENPKVNTQLLAVPADKTTLYGELFVGTLQWCSLGVFAVIRASL